MWHDMNTTYGTILMCIKFKNFGTWCLNRPRYYSDPSIYFLVFQVPVTLFMSSIVWLEDNMFIKVYGLHSLTKLSNCIIWEDNEHDEYVVKIICSNIQKEDAHIKIDIQYKLILLNIDTRPV